MSEATTLNENEAINVNSNEKQDSFLDKVKKAGLTVWENKEEIGKNLWKNRKEIGKKAVEGFLALNVISSSKDAAKYRKMRKGFFEAEQNDGETAEDDLNAILSEWTTKKSGNRGEVLKMLTDRVKSLDKSKVEERKMVAKILSEHRSKKFALEEKHLELASKTLSKEQWLKYAAVARDSVDTTLAYGGAALLGPVGFFAAKKLRFATGAVADTAMSMLEHETLNVSTAIEKGLAKTYKKLKKGDAQAWGKVLGKYAVGGAFSGDYFFNDGEMAKGAGETFKSLFGVNNEAHGAETSAVAKRVVIENYLRNDEKLINARAELKELQRQCFEENNTLSCRHVSGMDSIIKSREAAITEKINSQEIEVKQESITQENSIPLNEREFLGVNGMPHASAAREALIEAGFRNAGEVFVYDEGSLESVFSSGNNALVGDLSLLHPILEGVKNVNNVDFYENGKVEVVRASLDEAIEGDLSRLDSRLMAGVFREITFDSNGDLENVYPIDGKPGDPTSADEYFAKLEKEVVARLENAIQEVPTPLSDREFLNGEGKPNVSMARKALLEAGFRRLGLVDVHENGLIAEVQAAYKEALTGDLLLLHPSLKGFENVEIVDFGESGNVAEIAAVKNEAIEGDFSYVDSRLKPGVFRWLGFDEEGRLNMVYPIDEYKMSPMSADEYFNLTIEKEDLGLEESHTPLDERELLVNEGYVSEAKAKAAFEAQGVKNVAKIVLTDEGFVQRIYSEDGKTLTGLEGVSPKLKGVEGTGSVWIYENGDVAINAEKGEKLTGLEGVSQKLQGLNNVSRIRLREDGLLVSLSSRGVISDGNLNKFNYLKFNASQEIYVVSTPHYRGEINFLTYLKHPERYDATEATLKTYQEAGVANVSGAKFNNNSEDWRVDAPDGEVLSGPLEAIDPKLEGMGNIGVHTAFVRSDGSVSLYSVEEKTFTNTEALAKLDPRLEPGRYDRLVFDNNGTLEKLSTLSVGGLMDADDYFERNNVQVSKGQVNEIKKLVVNTGEQNTVPEKKIVADEVQNPTERYRKHVEGSIHGIIDGEEKIEQQRVEVVNKIKPTQEIIINKTVNQTQPEVKTVVKPTVNESTVQQSAPRKLTEAYVIQKGDTVTAIVEKTLKAMPGTQHLSTKEIQNIVGNLEIKLAREPGLAEKFNMRSGDINKIYAGDTMNINAIFEYINTADMKAGGVEYNSLLERADVLDQSTNEGTTESNVVETATNKVVNSANAQGRIEVSNNHIVSNNYKLEAGGNLTDALKQELFSGLNPTEQTNAAANLIESMRDSGFVKYNLPENISELPVGHNIPMEQIREDFIAGKTYEYLSDSTAREEHARSIMERAVNLTQAERDYIEGFNGTNVTDPTVEEIKNIQNATETSGALNLVPRKLILGTGDTGRAMELMNSQETAQFRDFLKENIQDKPAVAKYLRDYLQTKEQAETISTARGIPELTTTQTGRAMELMNSQEAAQFGDFIKENTQGKQAVNQYLANFLSTKGEI